MSDELCVGTINGWRSTFPAEDCRRRSVLRVVNFPQIEITRGSEDELFQLAGNDPFMPIDFPIAAYRFGHSMARSIYRLNTELGSKATRNQNERGVAGRNSSSSAPRK